MDGLSFLNPAVNLLAEELSFFLRDIRSGPRFDQQFPIVPFSSIVNVKPLVQRALILLAASVAHIRRFLQFRTMLFLKLRAILIAQGTCAALTVTPGTQAHVLEPALSAVDAAVRYPVVTRFLTRHSMLPDLPYNR